MLRTLFELFDGFTIRHLIERIVLTVVGLGAALVGLVFLLGAAFQALSLLVGPLDSALIFGIVFIIFALGLLGLASVRWNRRPRPMLARARLGVAAEALKLAQTVIRREPTKAVVAALVLGAVTEFTQKRKPKRPN